MKKTHFETLATLVPQCYRFYGAQAEKSNADQAPSPTALRSTKCVSKGVGRGDRYRTTASRMFRFIKTFTAALIISIAISGRADALTTEEQNGWKLSLNGYFKDIVLYTEESAFPTNIIMGLPRVPQLPPFLPQIPETIENDPHWDNYARLRLRMSGKHGGEYAWELHYEIKGIAIDPHISGSGLGARKEEENILSLEEVMDDQLHSGYVVSDKLDRAWFRWSPKWGEIVLGRQAITWTVGKLWYPTDLFSPFMPFDIDQDEKTGIDALNVAFNIGALNTIRFIYAPLDRREKDRVGALIKLSIKGFDAQAMGGYFSRDRVIGGSLSHNIFGAVARVEYAYTNPEQTRFDDRWSLIANFDVGFANNVYAAVEYYHQSASASNYDDYWQMTELNYRGILYGYSTDYAGAILNWSATPLLKPGIVLVYNLTDNGYFVGPRIEYKPMQNVTLAASANLFIGEKDASEFGMNPNIYFCSIKTYF